MHLQTRVVVPHDRRRQLRGSRSAAQQEDMQIRLRCQPAQLLEDIDAGHTLLQRTAIKTRGNQQ